MHDHDRKDDGVASRVTVESADIEREAHCKSTD